MNQTDTDGASAVAPRSLFSDWRAKTILAAGGLCLVAWGVFLGMGLSGAEEYTVRLLADVLLGFVVFAGASAQLKFGKLSIATLVVTIAYAFAWRYIGWNLLWGTSDAIYFLLAGLFYIAPLVAGLLAVLTSRFARRS